MLYFDSPIALSLDLKLALELIFPILSPPPSDYDLIDLPPCWCLCGKAAGWRCSGESEVGGGEMMREEV